MAHFALTRAGGWATLYVPTAADFNSLDTKTFKAINGDEGGSWSPSASIVVGGQGFALTGSLHQITGLLNWYGGEAYADPASVWDHEGVAGFGNTVNFSGEVVQQIIITNGGSGYTAPPVVVIAPPGGVLGTPVAATAVATITGGVVTAITITNKGAGYSANPAVTIAPPTSGVTATAFAFALTLVNFNRAQTTFASGSQTLFSAGSFVNVDGAFVIQSGAVQTVQSGGYITLQAANTLRSTTASAWQSNGDSWLITDGTNPTFQSARIRFVAQPMAILANTGGGAAMASPEFFGVTDAAAGQTAYVACTKIINGATLASVSVSVSWSATHTCTGSQASITLWKVDTYTATATSIGSASLTTGTTSGGTNSILEIASLTEVIDDSRYTYVAQYTAENGSGSSPIRWSAPNVGFGNITTVGQV